MRPGTANRVGGVKVERVSVTGVPLLLPRVAPRVIAVLLPEPGFVVVEDPQPRDPLGALPEVQMRHQQPRRTAVLGGQRFAVELPGEPRPSTGQVRQWQVRGVPGVRVRDDMGGGLLRAYC